MASHGNNGDIRPAAVQLYVIGVPSVAPKLPKPREAVIWRLPAVVEGTRHEYEQKPSQPNSNWPDPICFPDLLTVNWGGFPSPPFTSQYFPPPLPINW